MKKKNPDSDFITASNPAQDANLHTVTTIETTIYTSQSDINPSNIQPQIVRTLFVIDSLSNYHLNFQLKLNWRKPNAHLNQSWAIPHFLLAPFQPPQATASSHGASETGTFLYYELSPSFCLLMSLFHVKMIVVL